MRVELYAAITLGSNSFNMLVARTRGHRPQVIAKYKRKVRLAEGVNDGCLNDEVMQRGLDCLAMFGDMLEYHKVPPANVAVVATATLRTIANADEFSEKAQPLLGHPIEVISGMREAELIYQGMVANTKGSGRRLVLDIGGASTEFIVGEGQEVLFKGSVGFGCVTFTRRFFADAPYQLQDFEQAAAAVDTILGNDKRLLKQLGWHGVVGASGSVQSVIELLAHREVPQLITLEVLKGLQQEILAADDASLGHIVGLNPERAPTFAAGVAILLALFNSLGLEKLHLSGGALREGVLQLLADRLLED
ncbi:exopolyphosphatase [Shewanella sp. NIFS-20-20]|uniref:Ppx/GppA phosphatase family protein n=1 Tax=Shewanella sp. NIFS-20-20 TaxID=2853806 RepID=UPI001C461C7E|nr:exopolyphosphatase [Shewanella sp. NIFS-20-20]MBV7317359.1 exopolyphosphatase [Shewanella sp. NIFS-20-20]